ncbi:DNA replication and repair protein RecR [Thiothrix caldifontis]|jgi:recombination protein RecR|uniref:Recombination protein RecR n=2 Tax=Thiothrix TaxID=1030 RepID=A0A1H4GTT7_9GAMM|nr:MULTISPECIES: recombination mediator RecR [Thiothrix]QQZ27979.1 recombination protein RecR [Thiothrix subterranea]WML86433.1 recombination mediator RecR [Thiothrix subterranea]SEB12258.1 DNA replication and repair protein RecR [Thiothrix caldifontis]
MSESSLLKELVDALRCLPGIGSRTAQRMAFHLLENDRRSGERLADVMGRAMRDIKHCSRCRTLTEHDTCRICANPARQPQLLCVVEHPSDVVAVEQATGYRGYYFVLGGRLSPLDGIGPEDIGLDVLEARLDEGEVQELILATNPTVEGEVTAHYISELAAKRGIPASRIAHGVPMGSELEYVDSGTLSHAFEGRRKY